MKGRDWILFECRLGAFDRAFGVDASRRMNNPEKSFENIKIKTIKIINADNWYTMKGMIGDSLYSILRIFCSFQKKKFI